MELPELKKSVDLFFPGLFVGENEIADSRR